MRSDKIRSSSTATASLSSTEMNALAADSVKETQMSIKCKHTSIANANVENALIFVSKRHSGRGYRRK